ncbi:hypothetical protein [Agrobacterium albertimagni]|nr:hypothetical protein [Agrobacterium albertimagni]
MKRFPIVSVAVLLAATPAFPTDAIPWKEVGGWVVMMDPTLGNACYVSTIYEDGTVLRLGFNFTGSQGAIYIALGNQNWKSLEPGKDYPVVITFDRETPWNAVASGMEFSNINWLTVHTTDMDFAAEFARKHTMNATFQGRSIATLQLRGSARAVSEMLNCQDAVKAYSSTQQPAPQPADPFAVTPDVKSATDPFAL